jgi:hypothetical protein
MTVLVLWYMIKQKRSGKRPLLCLRNVFLAGVILFQLSSASLAYFTQQYTDLPVGDPVRSGVVYLLLLSLFLVFFTLVYELGWFTFGLLRRDPRPQPVPGTAAMVAMSLASLGVTVVLRLGLTYIPLVGVLADIAGFGFAAFSAGCAAWAWSRHPFNLGLLVLLVFVAGSASAMMLYEAFGRREVLSVLMGCLWGAYHGRFKYISIRRGLIPLTAIGAAGLVLLTAFTSIRGNSGNEKVPFAETVRRLSEADLGKGFEGLFAQDAPGNSLFIIENRPSPYPYDPLASLVYFAVHPIPRTMWQGKPDSLGTALVKEVFLPDKGEGLSLGPGLVGHIVNDNPWLSLPIYAILLAASLRVLDELLKRYPDSPYVVMPLGVALGEVLALARGELGQFAFRAAFAMAATYFGVKLLAGIMRVMGFASARGPADNEDQQEQEFAELATAYEASE